MMPASYYDQHGKLIKKEKVQIEVKTPKKTPEEAKAKEKGKERKTQRGFISRFDGLNVQLKLLDSSTLTGKLSCDAYNKYDILIATDSGDFLVPKHAVVYIHEEKECK